MPPAIASALGLGRLVALTKPSGRVRGIVVSDFLRRLAQQYAAPIQEACSPHQFALSTRFGTDSVVHALSVATELGPTATIVSVDGVGAFDTISRTAMLRGLQSVPGANFCLPFVRLFYTTRSEFVWHDADAMWLSRRKVALYALGRGPVFAEVQGSLRLGEPLPSFLDDTNFVF